VLLVIEVKLMLKAIRKGPDDILPSLQQSAVATNHANATGNGQA